MPFFGGFGPPVVMQAVEIAHGCRHKVINRHVVQRGKANGEKISPNFLDISVSINRGPAIFAKPVMPLTPISASTVVGQHFLATQQTEIILARLPGIPHPLLPAIGAVAFIGALIEINRGFKGNRLAVAASVVSEFHFVALKLALSVLRTFIVAAENHYAAPYLSSFVRFL